MAPTEKGKCLSKTIDIYKVRKVYGELFYALRAFINNRNPMDFYHLEAQPDEYDPEVATIIIQLHQKMTKEDIYDLVFQEFNRWFKPIPISKVVCLELSVGIFDWLSENTLPEVDLETLIEVKN
ncbi:hypothetical protein [Psychroflexus salis]|uniref:Uncharacterized protein n=1 Tax=Psychroflexus salis TaxID=1526574 RepID=A0A916ZW71_9FLAO|nr:hypothetical protein [Psychroflexus salis]GGE15664.1 hypothetical protein GCM10010831_16220 [Psychroflexus salis]